VLGLQHAFGRPADLDRFRLSLVQRDQFCDPALLHMRKMPGTPGLEFRQQRVA